MTNFNERLEEIEAALGSLGPSVAAGVEALLGAADRAHIEPPSALFGSHEGDVLAVWQSSTGRCTVYVQDAGFLVEVVPHGPAQPFSAVTAEAAVAHLRSLLTAP